MLVGTAVTPRRFGHALQKDHCNVPCPRPPPTGPKPRPEITRACREGRAQDRQFSRSPMTKGTLSGLRSVRGFFRGGEPQPNSRAQTGSLVDPPRADGGMKTAGNQGRSRRIFKVFSACYSVDMTCILDLNTRHAVRWKSYPALQRFCPRGGLSAEYPTK